MWVVISRNDCSFCEKAESLLSYKGEHYTEYNLQDPESKWLLTLLKESGYKTVPQIFKPDGTHLGGYEELVAHFF